MPQTIETKFDQRANDRCRSQWRCHPCDMDAEARMSDLAEVGPPLCPSCGDDMELVNVVIDPE